MRIDCGNVCEKGLPCPKIQPKNCFKNFEGNCKCTDVCEELMAKIAVRMHSNKDDLVKNYRETLAHNLKQHEQSKPTEQKH